MNNNYLSIYAFNDKEIEILDNNKNIVNGTVKLSFKDVRIYFYLKKQEGAIGVTDLVRQCLVEQGFDINDLKMYKPRKKPNSETFYETGSFWGHDEYRVDTFSRSLSKLMKAGLVKKISHTTSNAFETIVKE